jgi:hypothetical protein
MPAREWQKRIDAWIAIHPQKQKELQVGVYLTPDSSTCLVKTFEQPQTKTKDNPNQS